MATVKVTDRIDASPEAVWALLRDFGGIQKFSAGIESCSVEGEGVGAVRTLGMPGGISFQERLERFDDAGRSLSYSILPGAPLPLADYLATIRLSDDGGACAIEWSSSFEPKGVSEEQGVALVEGIYKGGIAGLKKAVGG